MRYPNRLRVVREKRKLTQWDVAKAVDITLDRYGRLELGKTEPSYDEARRLARFFKVLADAIFPSDTAAAS